MPGKGRPRRPTPRFEGSRLQRAIIWVVAIKIAAILIVFDPLASQPFDLPKSLVSRATMWPLAAMVVLAIFHYGFAVIPRTRLHLAVLAVAVVTVLSGIFAADHYLAAYGEQHRYLGLTFTIDMLDHLPMNPHQVHRFARLGLT